MLSRNILHFNFCKEIYTITIQKYIFISHYDVFLSRTLGYVKLSLDVSVSNLLHSIRLKWVSLYCYLEATICGCHEENVTNILCLVYP